MDETKCRGKDGVRDFVLPFMKWNVFMDGASWCWGEEMIGEERLPRYFVLRNDVGTRILDIGPLVGKEKGDLTFEFMDRYVCIICGYVYDPAVGDAESGIEPGTPFEDLPEDWVCPICSVGKEHFEVEM